MLDRDDLQLRALRQMAQRELAADILPFWEAHAFSAEGALRGGVTGRLEYVDELPRHAVLAARILWTFAAAAEALPEQRERLLATGQKAHDALTGPMWDSLHGGVFWSLGADGAVVDPRKQVYAQAFAVYGLARWARTTGDAAALDRALWLAAALDSSARDREYGGYVEALARDWTPTERTALSERDPDVPKSMNTNLHVLEALTELLRASGDAAVRESLETLLRTTLEAILVEEPFPHCGLYFDESWERRDAGVSYGHDIEASWLLWDAWTALTEHGIEDPDLEWGAREAALGLAAAVRERGVDRDGAVMYAGTVDGPTDTDRHWWPQAEGVVGWLNAYAVGGRPEDRKAAIRAWDFIETHVVDRENGEWFARLDAQNRPLADDDGDLKMGPWKCPYHNARACLEVLRRIAAEPAYA
ncbi:AGE family epimerase/isomerase [Demequina sp. SYSU T00039]|uniref:Cellobiose 2-epimerase n=1 Tax=Demequina lignilytica TaxID=3051663 RepID=A0AAW7M7R7_9MICO|nr:MULTISPECIES: AGE family epimerase/isomerase [unclassified Demequina]MDN4478353.1 AGE family epimerase/isomerase [Demequina sp. SYSU T00039-1]MDN4487140.1 AGE family epimerase/isomerase [Demequina sp. SYSU T00039]MDN4489851.1 AGE family epimerase/isomerase [Demequina sp. SYSU T00068]